MPEIAILGAGVIGLSTALRLSQELTGAKLTILASEFDAATTSAGAAGLWEPYKLSDTPAELIRQWGSETFRFLQSLLHSSEAASAGISEVTAHQLWTEAGHEEPEWASLVPHFHHMTPTELAPYSQSDGVVIKQGWAFSTLICEGAIHLLWLQKQLWNAGVSIVRCKVTSLQELSGYDVVVNCTGMGSRTLFGDQTMYPIRGHVIRVRAPWIKGVYFTDEQTYVIPNADSVVLGGTGDVNSWSTEPNARDRNSIWQRCLKMLPSLAEAEFIREWVGLRPGRPSVRLEKEVISVSGNSKPLFVVHNYGHGGAGLTLAWGCAGHASRLVLQCIKQKKQEAAQAKM